MGLYAGGAARGGEGDRSVVLSIVSDVLHVQVDGQLRSAQNWVLHNLVSLLQLIPTAIKCIFSLNFMVVQFANFVVVR